MENVISETRDRIVTLRINRPDKKNALTDAIYRAIGDAIAAADADENVRVLVLIGIGDAFTAGNDMVDFLN